MHGRIDWFDPFNLADRKTTFDLPEQVLGKSMQLQEILVGKHVGELLQRPGAVWVLMPMPSP